MVNEYQATRNVSTPDGVWGKFWHKLGNAFHGIEKGMDYVSRTNPYKTAFVTGAAALVLGLATFGGYSLVSGEKEGISDIEFYQRIESLRDSERKEFINNLDNFLKRRGISFEDNSD